ncbi:MAG: class I adenylate-forming enzyme family protein [Planctomycetota bacterium]
MPEPALNFADLLLAAGTSDAPAVVQGDVSLGYGALRGWVAAMERELAEQAIPPGDRIGLLAENGPFFVACYLAVIRGGRCVVPLPADMSEDALARLSRRLDLGAVIVSSRWAAKLPGLRSAIADLPEPATRSSTRRQRQPRLLREEELPTAADGAPLTAAAQVEPARDLAAIMLTSGSTGEPKGVMVSHRNLLCNTRDILAYTGMGPADRAMAVLPFYYCFGASLLHTLLAAGGTTVINNRFMFPEKVLDDLAAQKCTGMAGVPSTYQILLRKTRFAARRFPSLRWLQQAGGKLPDPFIRELRAAHPQVRLFIMYGQTEATARLSYLPPERLEDKLGSIGRGLPGTRLEVLRSDGSAVEPGSDEIGEIVASGDNITLGYWNDPEETERFFRGGRLFTGDMARLDADGFLFIVERARDFIKSMGNRVSPKEVEEVLCELPEVVEAAVVGVADEIWGEAIKACIVPVPESGLSPDAVRAHCLTRLPNYKIPQYVELLRELPRTSNGKVAKERLRG